MGLFEELARAQAELTGPGGQFEIVEQQVLGNRIRCHKNAPSDVRAFWLSTILYAERTYQVFGEERITYAEAHRQVTAIAAWLWDQGLRPGDRIAIAMRNYPEWMLIYWACGSIGVASVGMNAWWTPDEMAYALNDSTPKILFADAERLERFRQCQGLEQEIQAVGVRLSDDPAGVTPYAEVIAHPGPMPEVSIDPDADMSIFYTSGTTGFPKGAQLTHRGCIANLVNILYAGACTALATERATGVAPPAEPPVPIALLTTPLFHVTANNCGAYAATALGGALVLMHRWDAGEALELIERERITGVGGVPMMAREIINHPHFADYDTSSLLSVSGGGAQVPPAQVGEIDRALTTARPLTGYGMTETCGIITSFGGDFFLAKPDCAGPAMPNFEAKCVDDDGNEVAIGQAGELWVRGSSVIKGYINRPEATAETITQGWLHTGDIARIDEHGLIYIVDRKKDMVLRGGENVYCTEVEAGIYRHPAVLECCVFGLPDERLGEEVAVAVVTKPGMELDETELRKHCAEVMAKHKIPRFVWFMDEPLPRNANGKFLRRELKERLSGAGGRG